MTERKIAKSSSNVKKQTGNGHRTVDDENEKKSKPIHKTYVHRNSVLTDLMEVDHFQAVYNISVAIFAILVMTLTMYYVADPEVFYRDIRLMAWAAGKLHIFFLLWTSLFVICLLTHKVFCIWALHRSLMPTFISDFLFILFFISVCVCMFFMAPYTVITYEIGPITAFAAMAEQVRMFMKMYSFVIENFSKMKNLRSKNAKNEILLPKFNHFLYFMVVPVLIYKDSYPQTKSRNWKFIFENFFKVFACIFISYCYVLRFNVDVFSQIGLRTYTAKELVLIYLGCAVFGSATMFLIFYMLLHSWLNAFAEITKFGDRQFYKDWWNSTSFSQYYRTWNVVVYDWIYTYVYVHLHTLGLNKRLSMMMVLIASSAFHDYIISFALGYFYPALGIIYSTIGFVLVILTSSGKFLHWNIFVHFMLYTGWGVLIFLFTGEWYARKNCPSYIDGPFQHVMPRLFSCQILA